MMTTTNELFLPARIIYRVRNDSTLLSTFRNLRSMAFEPPNNRWTWNYEFEACEHGFPAAYEEIPRERQPVVLAACYLVRPGILHVYVRSALRLTKTLVFFDKHVPRTCAEAEFLDTCNFLTVHDGRPPLPKPEDFFADESKIVFHDFEEFAASPSRLMDAVVQMRERTLEPLTRNRLDAFYEEGEQHLKYAARLREVLAMKQHLSKTPIRPLEFLEEVMRQADSASEPSVSVPLPRGRT